jgi:hypothetical protein
VDQILQAQPTNASDILRTSPGVRAESSGGGGNANVTVRGLPISAGDAKSASELLGPHMDALAAKLEAAAEDHTVSLPHDLAPHELPHWPTQMAVNEICK